MSYRTPPSTQRPRGRRYVQKNPDPDKRVTVDNLVVSVTVGTLFDRNTHEEFAEGWYRVSCKQPAKNAGYNTRVFKGETAWCDAERYADDAVQAAIMWHRDRNLDLS